MVLYQAGKHRGISSIQPRVACSGGEWRLVVKSAMQAHASKQGVTKRFDSQAGSVGRDSRAQFPEKTGPCTQSAAGENHADQWELLALPLTPFPSPLSSPSSPPSPPPHAPSLFPLWQCSENLLGTLQEFFLWKRDVINYKPAIPTSR